MKALYKIKSFGKYTRQVYICPHCKNNMMNRLFQNICGFADSNIGLLQVIECDRCFEKFSCHARDAYQYFLKSIEVGDQVHFDKNGRKL